jgi:hypothetical protein
LQQNADAPAQPDCSFGSDFARQGVKNRSTCFCETRKRAQSYGRRRGRPRRDALDPDSDQEDISAMTLSRMIEDMNKVSPYYKVRLLDFVSRIRDDSAAPVAPLIVTGHGRRRRK